MDQQLKIELDQIQKFVSQIDIKVTGIIAFLRGNELDKDDKGIVGRVNDLEERLVKLEKWRDRIVWALVGMGFPAGVGTWELIKSILTHKT